MTLVSRCTGGQQRTHPHTQQTQFFRQRNPSQTFPRGAADLAGVRRMRCQRKVTRHGAEILKTQFDANRPPDVPFALQVRSAIFRYMFESK